VEYPATPAILKGFFMVKVVVKNVTTGRELLWRSLKNLLKVFSENVKTK
jgi:hypothetical protein